MSKSNAYALDYDDNLKELYSKVEEAVIKIDEVEKLEGFKSLRKQHREIDFDIIKKDLSEFLSLIDDYTRGEY
jgi:pyoverdine/dityrosine biosynthesis protein Dit1